MPPVLETWSLNHWITREVLVFLLFLLSLLNNLTIYQRDQEIEMKRKTNPVTGNQ